MTATAQYDHLPIEQRPRHEVEGQACRCNQPGCPVCNVVQSPVGRQHFLLQVMDEIAARRRHGLLRDQTQFRCNKMLLDHPERIPAEGLTVDQAADFVEALAS